MREFVSIHTGDEQPGVATLTWSRPPSNALTRQLYRELAAAAAEVGRHDGIAAVILFGGPEIFSAGDDAAELRTLAPRRVAAADRMCRAAFDALAAIPRPTVAAITGYALGSGLTLALTADWRVAGDNVKFGATDILAGRPPTGGGGARLATAIGASKAKDLVFSGRFVGAEEALSLGLIDEMVAPDDVYDAALAWARRLTGHAPPVLAAAKAAVDGHPPRARRGAAPDR
ncbi:enoyl-CoA hydratase [Mycolicibacterium thermoresistibile]|jgi:enoyl-CoA hydratase|uniref:Enoyl-CoA hydratase n=1 Tax=Mycolicibacterium thermoresistibile (strain ATCC 19527 / DSM 44167 / CIP 105390 / JCM 6362 / NCTC 10409 / 316) TaxID=1078020 RepID=G7CEM6_MYCT3|nr:enoyl-CoA hydratase [Mycolicibacterium thermoresistibile]EHI13568.1 enoyl-CoA hydratase [Mycolicibacterium thermoresistibile ATCC 19527]MCV7189255.1 enoyl-CoA hydratase [Mycolicibacterium thermoresistibile]SNW17693.1 enoyl-CoA hydratase/carnithine racemase [Mycolicibacterium thermoresistibile]